jgi:hypothetical protein
MMKIKKKSRAASFSNRHQVHWKRQQEREPDPQHRWVAIKNKISTTSKTGTSNRAGSAHGILCNVQERVL